MSAPPSAGVDRRGPLALLIAQPLMSLVYLGLVRGAWVAPQLLPIVVIGLLPLAAIAMVFTEETDRVWRNRVLRLGIAETIWTLLAAVLVGMAAGLGMP